MATDTPMPKDRVEFTEGRGQKLVALTQEEFAQRFQASGRLLWTVAAGVLGDTSEADDVLQEAGMMAFAKLDQYQPGTNFQAWMAQFVRNVALNHGRRRQRRRPTPVESEGLEWLQQESALQARPDVPVDGRGKLRSDQAAFDDQVLAGLRSLGDMQRSCLLLRSVLDLSYREIASTLGMPEGTAMSHVHRARAIMRERLLADAADGTSMEDFG